MVFIVYVEGHRLYFPNISVFLSLKILFVITNRVDPDEMPHYATFYLGLSLPEYAFKSHQRTRFLPVAFT